MTPSTTIFWVIAGIIWGALLTAALFEWSERRPVGIWVQNAILAATLVAAMFIGLKQNEINARLVDLNYYPELDINYQKNQSNFSILNRGKAEVALWGDKLDDLPRDLAPSPFHLSPRASFDTETDKFKDNALHKIGQHGDLTEPFDFFVETQDSRRYVIHGQVVFRISNA